jgi:hypothetical protein
MIYYFLPGNGKFGGIKVGCRFVEALGALGLPIVLALPEGRAPQWLPVRAAVIDDREAVRQLASGDWAIINWPYDYQRLHDLPGRRAFHCQGTDSVIDPIMADSSVLILTCWKQASEYARHRFGRTPVEVGIEISPVFFSAATRKIDNVVAYMPRRGYPTSRRCMRACPNLDFAPIHALEEPEVAATLGRAGVFLATAVGECFGLPAIEAMAAGCLVASVPVLGGMEYLRPGENCVLAEPERLPAALAEIMRPESRAERARLRASAQATAWRYHPELVRHNLRRLLDGDLAELAR